MVALQDKGDLEQRFSALLAISKCSKYGSIVVHMLLVCVVNMVE